MAVVFGVWDFVDPVAPNNLCLSFIFRISSAESGTIFAEDMVSVAAFLLAAAAAAEVVVVVGLVAGSARFFTLRAFVASLI